MIAAALVWLMRWERLPEAGRIGVLATTVLASLVAIFMAVNFHLANGAPHPWLLPKDGFDDGIDLDSLLRAIQLVLIGVSVAVWRSQPHSPNGSSRALLPLWRTEEPRKT